MPLIRASNDFRVHQINKPVRLLKNENGDDLEHETVPELFNRIVENYGENPALAYLDHETKKWNFLSYKKYKEKVDKYAKVFIKLGLKRFGSVGVLAFNSVEWFITELATIHAGGVITGIYTTNSVDSTKYVLEKSGATIVIVDDAKQMEKVREVKKQMPHLKVIIQTREPFADKGEGYYTWDELALMDTDDVEQEYRERLADIAVNDCCSLIFTSGTTGNPKGVMLSHDNLLFVSKSGCKFTNMQPPELIVSYLPLSHIAAQIVDIYACLYVAGCTYFAERDALKGSLAKTLKDVRPTRFLGVPRVYEKMQEKMLQIGSRQNCLMRAIAGWAKRVTLQHHIDRMAGKNPSSFQYGIAKKFILSKVKQALGFDRCLTFASGAAPMNNDTKKYFLSLDIPIIEIFGMSESAGGHSFSTVDSPSFDTIGKGLPGCQTRIRNPDSAGNGELLMKGRHVFMGYVNDIDKTYETIIDDGWIATGDVAYVDHEGYIYITGRLKDIIITAGGENVPPNHIEQLVKSELPAISNAFLVGDRKKYLTMLITLKTQMAPDSGMPLDELAEESKKWMHDLGLNYKKLSDILNNGPDPTVLQAIQKGIDRANKKSISNAQKVQKFRILSQDFSMTTGEYGPTMKVKRNVVVDKYKDVIEKMYD